VNILAPVEAFCEFGEHCNGFILKLNVVVQPTVY
jgi:hypothetical protein